MTTGRRLITAGIVGLAALLLATAGASGRTSAPVASGDVSWLSFGNTINENRYSPLTQITPGNASQLGRAFTFDLNKAVPGIKKGQQSYPIVVNGTIYVTSGDDQVFAVNGTTGAMLWHYAPNNVSTFKNYGIVANRGLAYCDNKLFLLTLDMTVVALNPATGQQLQRVPIGRAVSGAYANYGYSETSAPVCWNHTLIVGAAGSDYGVRGFVMAYHTSNLSPAWANPFWTIPPTGTEWRSKAIFVGGGVNWTPEAVDTSTDTLYFGTAAPAPAYYPSLRPGNDPRVDSLVAVDLKTGKLKWWQQQMSFNEWAYDTSQPPMVYTAKVGGKTERIVSVATMEGVWFAYNAQTGAPIWQRVKVLDNVEHPDLKPGKPVAVYPSSIGGLNYSPASFDPQTGYVYNAASETASALEQQTPAQEQAQQLLLGSTFLGLANGDFGAYLQNGWKDYGSVSAIDVATGKRVWKFDTPQPERGGVTTTAGGVGFAGGGDGNMRAFDAKTGKVLWTFQTGYQIAAAPSVYSVSGKEYVAITVGGTTTSSNGGTQASQLQVFALGGSQTQSTGPKFTTMQPATAGVRQPATTRRVVHQVKAARSAGPARISVGGPVLIKAWNANTDNTQNVQGRVTFGGKPVADALVSIDGWVAPATDKDGRFIYPVDETMPDRHVVTVVGVAGASIGGRKLTATQQSDLLAAKTGISVGYSIGDISVKSGAGGTVVVTGRITYGKNQAPHPVQLLSYELTGTVTDSSGNPVQGAIVTTRTNDHKFWTFSRPTGANGKYTSFLVSADEEGDSPVPMSVAVAVGANSFSQTTTDFIDFSELKSSTLNIQLPSTPGTTLKSSALSPKAMPGAIYQGLLVGVVGGKGGVIKPVHATWPDASGRFELVLPASARGRIAEFWELQRQFFTAQGAKPGGTVDPAVYPKSLLTHSPQGLVSVKLG